MACHHQLYKSHRRNAFSPLFLMAVEKIITVRLRDTADPLIHCEEPKPVSREELNLLFEAGIVLKKTRSHVGDTLGEGCSFNML